MRALAGAAGTALLLAGCGGGGGEPGSATAPPVRSGPQAVAVEVGSGGCEPSTISLATGPATFTIHVHAGNTVTEVALVRRPIILAEVESLPTSAAVRSFSLVLPPGRVILSCPGGRRTDTALTITGAAHAAASPAAEAAVGRYRTWIEGQAHALVNATLRFTQALDAHDLTRARALYPSARVYYERVEPIAESFSRLDKEIDARAGDVPASSWSGFHPIERRLWSLGTTAGTDAMGRKLLADVSAVNGVATRIALSPAQIANGAVGLLDEVSRSKITGEEERYSHLDLVDFEANVDGAQAAFEAVRPLLPPSRAALARTIAERFRAVHRALGPYRRGGGFVRYTALTPTDTRRLGRAVDALAEPLSRVSALLVQTS
jgi:iron uptake system component EfeO